MVIETCVLAYLLIFSLSSETDDSSRAIISSKFSEYHDRTPMVLNALLRLLPFTFHSHPRRYSYYSVLHMELLAKLNKLEVQRDYPTCSDLYSF